MRVFPTRRPGTPLLNAGDLPGTAFLLAAEGRDPGLAKIAHYRDYVDESRHLFLLIGNGPHRTVHDHKRAHASGNASDNTAFQIGRPDPRPAVLEARDFLGALIERLAEPERAALACLAAEMTEREAAARLGVGKMTAHRLYGRIKDKARALLGD